MTRIAFTVNGIPGAQGNKISYGPGRMVETSKKVKPWRSDVKAAAETAITEWEQHRPLDAGPGRTWAPITGPVHITVCFRWPRPKSHYRTGRNAHLLRDNAPSHPSGHHLGDLDKLQRATFDALTSAGIWGDDCLVVSVVSSKRWCREGERVGASIRIEEMP